MILEVSFLAPKDQCRTFLPTLLVFFHRGQIPLSFFLCTSRLPVSTMCNTLFVLYAADDINYPGKIISRMDKEKRFTPGSGRRAVIYFRYAKWGLKRQEMNQEDKSYFFGEGNYNISLRTDLLSLQMLKWS